MCVAKTHKIRGQKLWAQLRLKVNTSVSQSVLNCAKFMILCPHEEWISQSALHLELTDPWQPKDILYYNRILLKGLEYLLRETSWIHPHSALVWLVCLISLISLAVVCWYSRQNKTFIYIDNVKTRNTLGFCMHVILLLAEWKIILGMLLYNLLLSFHLN